MSRAVALAQRSLEEGGFPVGAVLVRSGKEISTGLSSARLLGDVTAHAEVQAIRAAGAEASAPLTLYSSLEPCLMCLAASSWAGVSTIVFGCSRDLVSQEYYEGPAVIDKSSKLLRHPPKIIVLSEFSVQVAAMIKDYKVRMTGSTAAAQKGS